MTHAHILEGGRRRRANLHSDRKHVPPPRTHKTYKDAVLGVSLGGAQGVKKFPAQRYKAESAEKSAKNPSVETLLATSLSPSFGAPPARRCKQRLYTRRRSADCASPLASALFSRGTCEMENFSACASLRQVQCKE